MRRLLFLAFLIATPVMAQETWTIGPVPAPYVTKATLKIFTINLRTCKRLSTAPSNPTPAFNCTQAQACVAALAVGGAACTPAQARAANARIFPNTQAGREEIVTFNAIIEYLDAGQREAATQHQDAICDDFKANPASSELTSLCSRLGLPAPPNCLPCQ